jgi:hypothetical protein
MSKLVYRVARSDALIGPEQTIHKIRLPRLRYNDLATCACGVEV